MCLFNQPSMCFCIRKLTANFLAKRVFKRCLDMFGPHFLHALRWIIVMRWCNKLLASHEPVYIYIILYICNVLIGDDCIQNTWTKRRPNDKSLRCPLVIAGYIIWIITLGKLNDLSTRKWWRGEEWHVSLIQPAPSRGPDSGSCSDVSNDALVKNRGQFHHYCSCTIPRNDNWHKLTTWPMYHQFAAIW